MPFRMRQRNSPMLSLHSAESRSYSTERRYEAVIITCCDSSVDADLVPSWRRESLLLLRTPAATVPEYGSAASFRQMLEFTVCNYRVPHIVVCGHSGCSEIEASMNGGLRVVSFDTDGLDEQQTPTYAEMYRRMARAAAVREHAMRHVLGQLEALREYPFIADRIAQGHVQLTALMYLHESGALLRYEENIDSFRAVRPSRGDAWHR